MDHDDFQLLLKEYHNARTLYDAPEKTKWKVSLAYHRLVFWENQLSRAIAADGIRLKHLQDEF